MKVTFRRHRRVPLEANLKEYFSPEATAGAVSQVEVGWWDKAPAFFVAS